LFLLSNSLELFEFESSIKNKGLSTRKKENVASSAGTPGRTAVDAGCKNCRGWNDPMSAKE
jgi:hypothetical protein